MTSITLGSAYNVWGRRIGPLTEEERAERRARPPKIGTVPELEFLEKTRARCTECGERATGHVITYVADYWCNSYPIRKRQHLACWIGRWGQSSGIFVPKRQALLRRKEFLKAYDAARRKKLVEVI